MDYIHLVFTLQSQSNCCASARVITILSRFCVLQMMFHFLLQYKVIRILYLLVSINVHDLLVIFITCFDSKKL